MRIVLKEIIRKRRSKMAEEKKVDEGLVEVEPKEILIDPETGEEKVPEVEPKVELEVVEKDWEKEFKTLQSKKDTEVENAKKEALRFKRLVSPYEKNIKETETGDLMFDFSEPEKPKERVEKPDENLWLDDPKKATEQLITFREQEREDRDFATREKDKAVQANKTFKADWDKSWDRTQKLYPDAAVEGSELQKKATDILNKNPKLGDLSDCNEICFKLAASELNIVPVKAKDTPSPEKKEPKDTSYIVSGAGSKGKSKKSNESKEETPDEYISRRKNLLQNKKLGVTS